MNRLIPALGVALLVAGCGSSTPTEPPAARDPVIILPPSYMTGTPNPIPGTSIAVGDTILGAIHVDDPVCFPNWDASARCRQYDLTASLDGTVVASLRSTRDADVFLVAPDGTTAYPLAMPPEVRASLPSKSGLTYRVVVISYGPFPESFELTVIVQP